MKNIITFIGFLLFAGICSASEINNLIGVIPGEVSKIHGRSVGGPFEILRIPTPNAALSKIFPDLEVMISRENKKIIGVSAKRAFPSNSDCTISQNKVRELLSKAFLSKYTGPDTRWQFMTSDSSTTAGVLCSDASPYPVLRLDVTHTQTNDEILRKFK